MKICMKKVCMYILNNQQFGAPPFGYHTDIQIYTQFRTERKERKPTQTAGHEKIRQHT